MTVIIKHASILNPDGVFIPDSYLVFNQGIIQYLGQEKPSPNIMEHSKIIDGRNCWVMPGMIDSHCHIGLFDDGLVQEGDDGNEDTDPITPQMQAIDGIFHEDRCFSEALSAGITTVMTGPGSANVLSGRFALLKTYGRRVDEMIIKRHSAMKAALGENPKRCHGQNKDRMPATRMATAAVLRDSLNKALWYARKKQLKPRDIEPDLRWESMLPVLRGEMIMKFHAHRTDDILTAVRIADEFGLRYTIDHCTEGWIIADLLKEIWLKGQEDKLAGTGRAGRGKLEGIIAGPLLTDRSKPELKRAELKNPAVLANTGIPVAIMTDHPVIPVQYLSVSAALAVREGMPENLALKSITSVAAMLCDAGDIKGQIASGYQADIIMMDGHPFDFRSHVKQVWINGETML